MFADAYLGLSQVITNQITESSQKHMSDWVIEIGSVVLGAVISGLLGWRASVWQNSRNAKDQLRIFISKKMASVPSQRCLAFYRKTKDEIRDAVFGTVPFVKKRQRLNLNGAWQKYGEIEDGLNDDSDEFTSLQSEASVQDGKPAIEKSSDIVKKHLASFIKAI